MFFCVNTLIMHH